MNTKANTPDTQTFEQEVNAAFEKVTFNDKNELVVPDDVKLSEPILFAVKAEKRRRDTQSAYTKAQQRAKELETERTELLTKFEKIAIANLPQEQRDELEALKGSDPEAWRNKLNELETKARETFKEDITKISTKAKQETELERRTRLIEEHNAANPKHQLTDDVIENDIPPRFTKQLEKGEITFEEFVKKCDTYLKAGKIIKDTEDPKTGKTLNDVGGKATPNKEDINKQTIKTYSSETY